MSSDIGARALEQLQTVFGYPAFRGQQGDIVEHVASGGDAADAKQRQVGR